MFRKLFLLGMTPIFMASAFSQESKTTEQETEDGKVVTTTTTDRFKVETNHFFDNCFVSFGVGTQFYMGDNEKHMHFKDLLTPAIDLTVGKWFSPGLGLALSYSGYKFKGLYNNRYDGQNFKTDIEYTNPKSNYIGAKSNLHEQKAHFYNIHIDALMDLKNIFYGYKEDRFYHIIPYIGVGWMQSYHHEGAKAGAITLNAGIINRFRLSDALDLNIAIRGALVDDCFDGEISGEPYRGIASEKPEHYTEATQNYGLDGYGGITIGLTYKFKTRGWNKARTIKETHTTEKEITRLKEELNVLRNQNETAKNNTTTVYVKKEVVTFPYLVNFTIDKAEVVNREKVNLKTIAEMIKSTPKQKYLICGYADKATGSKERNRWLAEHRAQNVYDVLTEEFGVSPEQLVTDSKGGIDNLYYDDPQVSRSVVISEIK